MITLDDLEWWLQTARLDEWVFAKTYADTAPHEYLVQGRCELRKADFVRAAKVIHTFGEPGKYWNSTNIYLTSPDGRWKWWTMNRDLNDTNLINRAATDRVYGVQDAPRTHNPEFTQFDAVATEYDRLRDRRADNAVRQQILDHFDGRPGSVLDVGCGTGALLDMGVADAANYTGIDPSQAMLNVLVRKHPRVKRVVPARFEDAHDLDDSYDLVVAMGVPGLDIERLKALSDGLLVVTG